MSGDLAISILSMVLFGFTAVYLVHLWEGAEAAKELLAERKSAKRAK